MPPLYNHRNINNFAQRDINIEAQTNNYYPERPETPPRPSAVIPFPRDADFVERGTILDEIHQRCAIAGSRAALVGLGGVGKSQLAIKYAYQTRERSAETWVLWVHASNAARFEQSYRDIADRVKIFGRKDPKADIFKLVHDWLCSSRDPWLLVLDNVDDAHFLVDIPVTQRDEGANSRGAPKPLRFYIPQSERGSVLVTTRSQDAALKLVEKRCMISVGPMNEVQACALFRKKHEESKDSISINELVEALEYMPLAIVQAAAYIAQKVPRCSVQQYLADFRRSDRKRMALFDKEMQFRQELRRDYEAKNSIIITWQISFDHIRETRPSAAGLLSLMSFFDRQGIPEKLLRAQPGEEPAQQEQHARNSEPQAWEDEDSASQSSAGDDEFEDDVQMLRDYSFISANTDGASFEMHRLVQLATRKWLQVHDELEQWKQRFVSSLCAAFPTGNYENWAVCQGLFAHAKSAAEQRPEREDSLRDWASLLYKAAWYALLIGNWVEAEAMSLQSTKTRRKILGVNHEDTLWSMANLASTYRNQGRWDAAEELEVQVMETRKKKLGADHPHADQHEQSRLYIKGSGTYK
ncbi:hypothetical protein K458DRAFT_352596 [Lentithecium fluviatile CBS 122367]|uniref:DUF7779 domain-containing protein n=1 Tax=Lentithecium fluviatile CBS 122367 TaxID=1168545 RepID=A0A6G1ICV0_9PLEO|nr:hypothetical protein K458DRAFT_352596 [Lentithecium fluviatile CBS 122367]